ncbi:hypothetical protein H9N25_11840 [Pedobacter riviphilus]|uniref:CdiA toxin EC869-like domain-containing protein n=1 Tax=Pedobacter riviphilus TaxID=2766984 RepID=A0ABX6TND8_9SPHI|nr:hypothetical protein [Pedobacter riviphilus]QNR87016.1 hypothetical protein H9N25_11840 [Pedobacter riviphilus]
MAIGGVINDPSNPESWGHLASTAILYKGLLKENPSIFQFEPNVRGFAYEKMKGGNLPNNFPTIDKLYGNEVTSIKSIDLKSKSYKSGKLLYNTLKKYVDALEKFKSGQAGGKSITPMDYNSKSLDVGYQNGVATKSQLEIFNQIKEYGKEKNINVEFNKVK